MLPVPSRHRSLTLFAVAIAAQVLFLAIQIRRGQQVRLIRVWAIESVSPLGRGAAWSVDGIRGLWNNYVALRHMREENDQLRKQMGTLRNTQRATGKPRGGSGSPGELARIPRPARRGADAGGASDRRNSRSGQPHGIDRPWNARWRAAGYGSHHAGRSGRQSSGGLSGHFSSAAAERQGKRRRRAAGDFAGAGAREGNGRPSARPGIRRQRHQGPAGRARAHVGRGSNFPKGFAGRHGRGSAP